MRTGKLTILAVKKLTTPGRYSDGGNLYLHVKPGSRAWTFRFTLPGAKAREMVLGTVADLSLADARDRARDARRLLAEGNDPIEARKAARAKVAGQGFTFREVAALYVASHGDAWRNAKHRAQWTSTLETYADPVMGGLPVGRVAVAEVMRVLDPVWKAKGLS